MRFQRGLTAAAAVVLLIGAVGLTQHIRKGSVATIRSDEMEVDWGTGVTTMTGNVRVEIKGEYEATLVASSVVVKADIEKSQLLSLEAHGPVQFDMITAPVNGQRSHIVARCSQSATFSETTMIVQLQGDAHAEIRGGGRAFGTAEVESARYDGESITVDLNKRTIKLRQATLEMQMAPPTQKPSATEGNQ
ncbi:MAG: LptA/OstA family protein [Candidatus Zipacnadales bacterium]